MIYSYSHPVTDGIYFYIRGGTTPAADFQIVKFSNCNSNAIPGAVSTPASGATFDGTGFNRYDAEHFHL